MVIDKFTKIILSLIAFCLIILTAIEFYKIFKPEKVVAKGGTPPIQRVAICNEKGEFCAMVDETSRLYVK